MPKNQNIVWLRRFLTSFSALVAYCAAPHVSAAEDNEQPAKDHPTTPSVQLTPPVAVLPWLDSHNVSAASMQEIAAKKQGAKEHKAEHKTEHKTEHKQAHADAPAGAHAGHKYANKKLAAKHINHKQKTAKNTKPHHVTVAKNDHHAEHRKEPALISTEIAHWQEAKPEKVVFQKASVQIFEPQKPIAESEIKQRDIALKAPVYNASLPWLVTPSEPVQVNTGSKEVTVLKGPEWATTQVSRNQVAAVAVFDAPKKPLKETAHKEPERKESGMAKAVVSKAPVEKNVVAKNVVAKPVVTKQDSHPSPLEITWADKTPVELAQVRVFKPESPAAESPAFDNTRMLVTLNTAVSEKLVAVAEDKPAAGKPSTFTSPLDMMMLEPAAGSNEADLKELPATSPSAQAPAVTPIPTSGTVAVPPPPPSAAAPLPEATAPAAPATAAPTQAPQPPVAVTTPPTVPPAPPAQTAAPTAAPVIPTASPEQTLAPIVAAPTNAPVVAAPLPAPSAAPLPAPTSAPTAAPTASPTAAPAKQDDTDASKKKRHHGKDLPDSGDDWPHDKRSNRDPQLSPLTIVNQPIILHPVVDQQQLLAQLPTAAPTKQLPLKALEEPATEEPITKSLSQDSKDIVERLPKEVRPPSKSMHNVAIERSYVNKGKDDTKKMESYGMKIAVKRPKMDVYRSLEAAYNSLIAGDQQYAITLYKDVLGMDPENTLALFGLATTYHRAGQIQLARPLYAQLLEIDPNHIEGLNNFLVLLADEAPDEALKELEKLRHSHPNFSPVLAQMALIHEKKKDYQDAAECMRRALALSPENLKYQYNMAIILDKMHNWDEAIRWYRSLIIADERGEKIPGNAREIQQRLTFIDSNK